MTTPHIRLVVATDTPDLANKLAAQGRPGWTTVAPPPTTRRRRLAAIASPVLDALGISADVSGAGRNANDDWYLAHLHLTVLPIEHLLVVDAHLFDSFDIQCLAELTAATDTNLWLLIPPDRITAELQATFDDWNATPTELHALLDTLPEPQAATKPTRAADLTVRVPACDFTTFRAAARDQLEPDAFAAVDARYRHVHQTTVTWARQAEPLDENAIADHIAQLFTDCVNIDQMLTTVRATQAALFMAGWYLQVDLDAFLGSNATVHSPAARSPETWTRLGAYRQPIRQAACALAAAGLSLDQMTDLLLNDVAQDQSTVTINGRQVTVEPAARQALRLQVLARITHGAQPRHKLMVNNDGKPATDAQLSRAVTDPATEVGVALTNSRVVRRTITPDHWARRRGLSIQPLNAGQPAC